MKRVAELEAAMGFDFIQSMMRQVVSNIESGCFSFMVACVEFEDTRKAEQVLKRLAKNWN